MWNTCRKENAGARRHRLNEPAAAHANRRISHQNINATNDAARSSRAACDHDSLP
jgi:hypothetical protein